MGYFSNGTEGMDYQERYCEKCWHDRNQQCPILMLHLLWNYEAQSDKTKATALNTFIPLTKDGLGNEKCAMFCDNKAAPEPSHRAELSKLQAWNAGEAIKVQAQ